MIQATCDIDVLERCFSMLNNNKNSNLVIFIEPSYEVYLRLDSIDDLCEPVFDRNMTNKSILGILTELIYNKETDYIVKNLEIQKEFNNKYTINVELNYKNKVDELLFDRELLFEELSNYRRRYDD